MSKHKPNRLKTLAFHRKKTPGWSPYTRTQPLKKRGGSYSAFARTQKHTLRAGFSAAAGPSASQRDSLSRRRRSPSGKGKRESCAS
eukprot:5085600-Pyramimonas_sp.AAC.1